MQWDRLHFRWCSLIQRWKILQKYYCPLLKSPPPKKKRKRKKLIKEPIDIRELQHTSLVTYLLGRLASRGPRYVLLVDKALEEIELSQFNSYVVCEAFLCLTGGADAVVCFVLGFEYLENILDFGFLFRVPCCSSVSKVMFFNFNFEHSF